MGRGRQLEVKIPSNDATAEMVVWLDEIYQAVG